MTVHPCLLMAGCTGPAGLAVMGAFWENYRAVHPGHRVYHDHGHELQYCVPLLIHGDEGRTLRKSPVALINFQSPFKGLNRMPTDLASADHQQRTEAQHTTLKGNNFLKLGS